MDALSHDIRYAFRHVRRAPGFAAAAILTLAFAIGANTAMFTVLNSLVLQRLPIKDPDGLIGVTSRDARGRERYIPFVAVNELSKDGPLIDVCGYNGGALLTAEAGGVATQMLAAFVSGRCFTTFGVTPILGRPLTDADAPLATAGNKVVVIGYRFWRRMFAGDPAAIGKAIRVEGVQAEIVGVLPEGFGGLHVDSGIDVFAPPDSLIPARGDRRPVASQVLGRLRPGVTFDQAQAELSARWPKLLDASLPPGSSPLEGADLWGANLRLESFGTGLSSYRTRYASPLTLILWLTGALLLLACVNLGGLLLTRLMARGTELAVRLALGGSRLRIAQQMLVESLMLSMAAAVLAIPVSFAFVIPLVSFIPEGSVERTMSFRPDARVLIVTALVAVAVALVMTALPMWVAARGTKNPRFNWDRTVVGTTSHWARSLLVAQVALSTVLVVGAGLLVRSLYLLQHANLGVRTEGILHVNLAATPNAGRGVADAGAYYATMLEQLRALPRVRSAGFSQIFPRMTLDPATAVGFAGELSGNIRALSDTASPEFFDTVGIPLLAGRMLAWTDTVRSRRVCVVSESLARQLSPDGNVLERRLNFGTNRDTQDITIVGVVGNASVGNPRQAAPPLIYFPPLQRNFVISSMLIAVDGDPTSVAGAVREIVRQGGREYPREIISVDRLFARAPSAERMSAAVGAAVGMLAIALALIGIHGALAYAVSRRRREIGVRLAIGASPVAVARTVVREGLVVTVAGVAIGLPLALAASGWLSALLFGLSGSDPVTFAATALFFLAAGGAAGIVPARRAASVDPVVALRAE